MIKRVRLEEVDIAEIRSRFSYDPASGVVTSRLTGVAIGWIDACGYRTASGHFGGRRYNVRIHRLAWALHYGSWPEGEIDHINCIPSDNRIENLRLASRVFQNRNKIGNKLPPGVLFRPCSGFDHPFEAFALVGGKRTYQGRFASIREAQSAVERAEINEPYHFEGSPVAAHGEGAYGVITSRPSGAK